MLLLNRLVSDEGIWQIPQDVTVEHVLPQSPPKGSTWWDGFTTDQHEAWLHRLGNLVLLSRRRNASSGNKPFPEKKSRYFLRKGTSPFPLTSQVLAEPTWTAETVERRHAALTDLLLARWGA